MSGSFTDRFNAITVYPSEVGYQSYTLTTSTQLTWPEIGDTNSNLASAFIRASSTVTGAGFIMPDATQISPGRANRFRNIGSIAFPIFSLSGSTIATVSAGQDVLLSNIDNTTLGGLWDTEQLGVGTSSADAAFLAGAGLTVSTGGQIMFNWPSFFNATSGFSLTHTSRATNNIWTGGAGTWNIAFDADTVNNGWIASVKNEGTGILTVSGNFAATIDGGTIQLSPGDSSFIVSAGNGGSSSGFYTIGLTNANASNSVAIELDDSHVNNTLTNAQAANSIFIIQGSINVSGGSTVIFPQVAGEYTIINKAQPADLYRSGNSGGYVTFATSAAGGATVNVPVNSARVIVSDGTNMYFADDYTQLRPAQNLFYFADFSRNPWQRGTSFTSSSVSQYTADRASFRCVSGASWNINQVASTNTGTQYDLQVQRISGSPTSSVILMGMDLDISETIEMRGKSPTLAVQMDFGTSLQQATIFMGIFTSNGQGRVIDAVTVSSPLAPAGWTQLAAMPPLTTLSGTAYTTFMVDPVSLGLPTSSISNSAQTLSFFMSAQGRSTTADGNEFMNISRISMTPQTFSGFEMVDSTDILNRCQHYAYAFTASSIGQSFGGGQAIAGSGAIVNVPFPITMRKAPSLATIPSSWQLTTATGAPAIANSVTLSGVTDYSAQLSVSTTTSLLSAGNFTMLQAASGTAQMVFSADV